MTIAAGIDVGTGAVKAAIFEVKDGESKWLARDIMRIRQRDPMQLSRETFDRCLEMAGITEDDIDYVATTGEGESIPFHTGHFYSMTTHARGALFLGPEARAALDIGGLHARGLKMNDEGRVLGHRMTSQCASGSGQFLENIARYLGVPLDDVGRLSKVSESPEKVSSICAVLAETDVINMVARGISTSDILRGIHLSIAGRLVQLVRSVGAEGTVLLTGGLSQDEGLVAAVEKILSDEKNKKRPAGKRPAEVNVATHPSGVLAGAIGAALLGAYRHEQLKRRGKDLAAPVAQL